MKRIPKWFSDLNVAHRGDAYMATSPEWMRAPFRVGEFICVTDSAALLGIRSDADCNGNKPPEPAIRKSGEWLTEKKRTRKVALADLRAWVEGTRTPAGGWFYGVSIDRALLRAYIANLPDEDEVRFFISDSYEGKRTRLTIEGSGWRIVLMGLHNVPKDAPRFPTATAVCQ